MCGRRLARAFEGGERSHDPVHRSRLRDAFLATARDAHAELRAPTAADFDGMGAALQPELLPEEQAVLTQAAHWYAQIFGDAPGAVGRPGHRPTDGTARGARRRMDRPAGARPSTTVTSCVRSSSGAGGCRRTIRSSCAALQIAFLRLTPWLDGKPLRVVWVDLVRGLVREQVVEPDDRPAVTEWFDRRLGIVLDRAAEPTATPGDDCGTLRGGRGVPRAPEGRALRAPPRPPPGHPPRHAHQPRHVAPVPAGMAQRVPVRHPGERHRSRHRARSADARRPAPGARAGIVPRRRARRRRARAPRLRRRRPACAPSSRGTPRAARLRPTRSATR